MNVTEAADKLLIGLRDETRDDAEKRVQLAPLARKCGIPEELQLGATYFLGDIGCIDYIWIGPLLIMKPAGRARVALMERGN